ncbi:MAG: PfkB family carbohydrate kinase [Chloroflexota bacterium]
MPAPTWSWRRRTAGPRSSTASPRPSPRRPSAASSRPCSGASGRTTCWCSPAACPGRTGGAVRDARRRRAGEGARTLVDASGRWLQATLPAGPDLVKVNLAELADALGVTGQACWRDGGSLVPAVRGLVLSRGPRGARVWSAGRRCNVTVPRQAVVSAVGAGDAMTAGLASGIAAGLALTAAVAQGVAWGAAAVRELDLTLDGGVAREIAHQVRVAGCVRA